MSEQLKQLSRYLIPHPLLFGALPLLLFYAFFAMLQNQSFLVIPPLVVIWTATVILNLLLLVVFRKPEKAAFATTIFVTIFFTMTYLFVFSKVLSSDALVKTWGVALILIVWGLLFTCLFIVIITKKSLTRVTRIANEVGLWLVLLEVIVIVGHDLQVNLMWQPQMKSLFLQADEISFNETRLAWQNRKPDKPLPDVYMIILDENPSHAVLKRYFDYDNEWFIGELRKRGFVVATGAHSNYPRTQHTLSSMFNMTYINDLAKICGQESTDWSPTFELIDNGRVFQLFKAAGHKMFAYVSYPQLSTYINDRFIKTTFFNYFMQQFLQTTAIGLLPGTHEFNNQMAREQRLNILSRLHEQAENKEPKIVFAHIYLPHEPFIFDAKGNSVEVAEEIEGERWAKVTRDGFKDQTIFIEHKMIELVDKILANSRSQPIILIQGDHGPNSTGFVTSKELNDDVTVERYGILSAYLVPESMRGTISNTITPVNVFRAIMNHLTEKESFPLLEERMYYSPYPLAFKFSDITERLGKLDKGEE